MDNPVGSMVYDAANRLVRDAKHDYTYDAEGNLTSKKVRATGATTRYVWDSEHRLVELVKPSGATVRYRYCYDAAGMRVQATRSSDRSGDHVGLQRFDGGGRVAPGGRWVAGAGVDVRDGSFGRSAAVDV